MKKLLSAALAICMIFSSFSLAFASGTDKNVPAITDTFQKFGTGLASVFAGLINNITKKDESDIPQGTPKSYSYETADENYAIDNPVMSIEAETWLMNEITLTSSASYNNPFDDVDVDLVLIGNGRKYTVPGYWNGGNSWKIRFVCPSEGVWYFYTVCTNSEDSGLHNKTGKVNCKKYSGDLEIYKHGFVSANSGKRYLTYDDGTPFPYLGDTHWSLGDETVDMVKTIAEKRVSQGYTVIQSEPIGATFDFTDGITESDMAGLEDYDKKFAIIAENGLVHANAEFFFPSYITVLIDNFGGYSDKDVGEMKDFSDGVKAYLEKISRYWVARYGSYPVIWTLGQEVDNDFYRTDTEHPLWSSDNNPYLLIADYIEKYDCWDHPLTAHMEHCGATSVYGSGKGTGENLTVYKSGSEPSIFRNVEAHDFYAVQWCPSKDEQSDYDAEKDFWYNSNGKPVVFYEGQYCYLWTKNYGARMQSWCAFLNGMCGGSWGGHDTWSYLNTYDEENDSEDGVDVITSEEKKNATWQDALEYESSYQCGFTLKFFEGMEWYNLIPRFDNKSYFSPCSGVYYCMASMKDNSEGVIYFYSFTDSSVAANANTKRYGGLMTGTIGNLEKNSEYKYRWVNPITGEQSEEMTFVSSGFGTYYIGTRQWNGNNTDTDMVFWYYS